MTLPRLHVVTNDAVLLEPSFHDRAADLMNAHGPAVALHLRATDARLDVLMERADGLVGRAREAGTAILINGRPDLSLAFDVGAHLGSRSVPVGAVRGLLGDGALIGYSAHAAGEAASAMDSGATFAFIGTIWETASHPGRKGAGLERVRTAAHDASGPVLAIGGVTPERAAEAAAAGAWGVAAVRGVWEAEDAADAAEEYLRAMGVVKG